MFWDWLKNLFSPPKPKIVKNPGWEWLDIEKNGADILVKDAVATWFGGDNDPQDNGETASGINTKGNPGLMACSLPMIYTGTNNLLLQALGGSPIPKVPWRTLVQVTNLKNGNIITVPVIDIGPARYTKHGIDLTIAAFKALGGSLKDGTLVVDYRVINAGQRV